LLSIKLLLELTIYKNIAAESRILLKKADVCTYLRTDVQHFIDGVDGAGRESEVIGFQTVSRQMEHDVVTGQPSWGARIPLDVVMLSPESVPKFMSDGN